MKTYYDCTDDELIELHNLTHPGEKTKDPAITRTLTTCWVKSTSKGTRLRPDDIIYTTSFFNRNGGVAFQVAATMMVFDFWPIVRKCRELGLDYETQL